jgi:hypothetical protein
MKAIETVYKGYKFRSRLEARWAVFFDALGVEWEYEKEGYDLGDDGLYLPDFYLPYWDCFIEIKPTDPISDRGWCYNDKRLNKSLKKSCCWFFMVCLVTSTEIGMGSIHATQAAAQACGTQWNGATIGKMMSSG